MSIIGNIGDKLRIVNEMDIKKFLSGELDNQVGEILLELITTFPLNLKKELEGKDVGLEFVIELKTQKAFKFSVKGASRELLEAFDQFYIVRY